MTGQPIADKGHDGPILESIAALRALARIMDADAPDVVALTHRIDTLAQTDADQARTMRAALLQLTGDHEGARKVELVLPETGVCSGDGCCVPPPTRQTISIGKRPLQVLQPVAAATSSCCDADSGCCS